MNTSVHLTLTQTPFEKFNTPRYESTCISLGVKLPTNIQFNRTYYRFNVQRNELQAFRILAITLNISQHICALIQEPNCDEPRWVDDLFDDKIFTSVDKFVQHASNGASALYLGMRGIGDILTEYRYAAIVGFRGLVWKWDTANKCATNDFLPRIRYILINEEGFYVCFGSSEQFYLNKAECVRDNLSGVSIKDFAEDPYKITINVLPTTAKIHTLKFIEE